LSLFMRSPSGVVGNAPTGAVMRRWIGTNAHFGVSEACLIAWRA
jgi:hypothetical protein